MYVRMMFGPMFSTLFVFGYVLDYMLEHKVQGHAISNSISFLAYQCLIRSRIVFVVFQQTNIPLESDLSLVRIPGEFKHIINRRKRN